VTAQPELLDEVVAALPAWQVLVVQYNDVVATRLGVSSSDLRALFVLAGQGPCTPGVLGRHVGLSTGAASRMVERLVGAGIVAREPDPHDRRRVVVTPRQEALDEVARHYAPLNRRLREHLGAFDEPGLRAMLTFVRAAEISTQELLDEPRTARAVTDR
jgi:DNA-binding MarR family transcriptional regulator